MDLQRLRQETAADHDRTEAAVPLISDGLTREAYAEVLARMYGFIRGWEIWADTHTPDDLRALLAERQRSGLIARDLAWLGHAVPAGEANFSAEAVTRPEFLGRMYVVEGSTLGGQYLAAHVETQFGFTRGEGNAYLSGYGARTGSMWNQFKAFLLEVPDTDAEAVIQSAKQMFASFEEWMIAPHGGPGEPRTESGRETHG